MKWRSIREIGHGIEEEPLKVDNGAFGKHHMIPGIGLAGKDDAAFRDNPAPGNDGAQIKL